MRVGQKKNSYGFFRFVFKEIAIIYNFNFFNTWLFFLGFLLYILFKSKEGMAGCPRGVKTRASENRNSKKEGKGN